jgi:regulator of sirC expression with transglutaminase-like and TPR domain
VQTDPRIWIDPFHGGRPVPRDALAARLTALEGRPPSPRRLAAALAPVGAAYVLARVENNLKGARLRRGDLAGALRATERLLEVAPELVEELRDRGLLRIRLGARAEGRADLIAYLQRWSTAPDRERVERAIAQAEREDGPDDA